MSGLQFAVFRNLPLTCNRMSSNQWKLLTNSPAHLLYEVQLDVCPEALLVEPDLPGEAEGVDLVEVVEDLLPVSPDSLGVLATGNTSQLSLSLSLLSLSQEKYSIKIK